MSVEPKGFSWQLTAGSVVIRYSLYGRVVAVNYLDDCYDFYDFYDLNESGEAG